MYFCVLCRIDSLPYSFATLKIQETRPARMMHMNDSSDRRIFIHIRRDNR